MEHASPVMEIIKAALYSIVNPPLPLPSPSRKLETTKIPRPSKPALVSTPRQKRIAPGNGRVYTWTSRANLNSLFKPECLHNNNGPQFDERNASRQISNHRIFQEFFPRTTSLSINLYILYKFVEYKNR